MIIKKSGKLSSEDSKTFKVETFEIPVTASSLEISFDYSPRNVFSLENHLNLLIYDSLGRFMGRHDRGTKKFVISLNPSPCALRALPLPGKWKAVLEAHSVLSNVNYVIEIKISGNETYEWRKGELHCHSNHSDGTMTVKELSDYFKRKDVDFFFLTDHTNTSGWRELTEVTGSVGFPGEELNTFSGHGLVLGSNKFIDWKDENFNPLPAEFIQKAVHESQGVFGVAHPFILGDPICTGCEWHYSESPFSFDFVEIWSRLIEEYSLINNRSIFQWINAVRRGTRVTGVAGSDLHNISDEKQLVLRTYVKARRLTLDEVLYSIKKGAVYIDCGALKELKVNGKGVGDIVIYQDGDLEVELSIDFPLKTQALLITKRETIAVDNPTNAKIKISEEIIEGKDFLIVWIKDIQEHTITVTNPIHIVREDA